MTTINQASTNDYSSYAKLASKLKVTLRSTLPADPNPFADWSACLFTADRTQYVMLTNTASLYSTLIFARGMSDNCKFLDGTQSWLHEFMTADGLATIHERCIAPATRTVRFSKALNRSVTETFKSVKAETV